MIKIDENFCELYGALIGDGCLSSFKNENHIRNVIRLDGHKENDLAYFNVLKKLIKNVFGKDVSLRFRKNYNIVFIYFQSNEIFHLIKSIGFPVGKKGEIVIPENLLNQKWHVTKYLLRGLMDTDGCVYFTKNGSDRHVYPAIDFRSISQTLINQMYDLLKKNGFAPYKRNTHLILYGKKNLEKWLKEIGFSNLNHISKIKIWKIRGECPPDKDLNLKERIEIINNGRVA